jgi:polyisoprenoid-binding protein YceI
MNMMNQKFKPETKNNRNTNFGIIKVTILLVAFSAVSLAVKATDYVVDKTASKLKWEARKVTGKHNGTIMFESGSMTTAKNKIIGGTFIVNMKTIVDEDLTDSEWNKKLIGHLSSDDFFSVEKFPQSKMEVKKATLISGNDYKFLTDLTIKGVTKPVEFTAKVTIDGDKLNTQGLITINRTLFGIKYGSGSFFQGLGDKMIFDDFTITFEVTAQK